MPAGGGDMSHSRALAAHSWSQGTPVALGSGKKRRREDDNNDSDEVTFKVLSLISLVSYSPLLCLSEVFSELELTNSQIRTVVITPLLPEEQGRREFKQMRMVLSVSLRGSVLFQVCLVKF